jgi:hypothetical protein
MQSAMYSIPELAPLAMAVTVLRARLYAVKEREGGYTTETVVVTGLLAAAAIIIIAIIVKKITDQANSLKTQ